MSDWPIVRLGDYCSKIGSGATPRGGASVYLDEGEICLIRSQNIYNEGFKPDGLVYITSESAQKLKNVIVEENDVLLNITGDSVARVCLAKKENLPARVNQHVAIIRPDPKEFDPRFIRYFLASPAQQNLLLTIAAVGATRNALTKNMIETLEVSKPPIEVQSDIADKLESLEKKIDLNGQTNQTLEQIAQAIFKSWFVDFDPTRAKIAAKEEWARRSTAMDGGSDENAGAIFVERAAMCAISGKALEELEQLTPEQIEQLRSTAALFPDALVDSELGEIPEGWEVNQLGTFIKFANGKAIKRSDVGAYPIYGANGIIGRSDDFKFDNSLIIGRVGAYCGSVKYCLNKFWASDNTIVAKSKVHDNMLPYLYYLLRLLDLNTHAGGAAQPLLNQTTLNKIEVVLPATMILDQYNKLVSGFVAITSKNSSESDELGTLRDTLLPKLLSGELIIEPKNNNTQQEPLSV